jgi:ankyrin repeat protein
MLRKFMYKPLLLSALVLSAVLCGCGGAKTTPPTAEEIAAAANAAFNGQTAGLQTALDSGMPVDQVDENGNTLLMLAAFNGHTEAAQVLLENDADVSLRDNNGRTALMFAASGPFPATVRLLLENGANVNAVDSDEHFTALMTAAAEGLSPIVDMLLDAGADPTMKDVDNDTAANFARQRGFTALANKLQALEDKETP